MSVIYVIKSVGDTLNMDTQYFVQELRKKWENAEVVTEPKTHEIRQWRVVTDEDGSILGDFNEEDIGFQVNSFSDIVKVAQWFRSIVPEKHRLILFDTALNFEPIEITPDITEDELTAGFEIPFDGSKFL